MIDVHGHFTALHPVAVSDARWALKPFARELQTYLSIVGAPYQPTDQMGVRTFAGVTVALTFDRARFAENVAVSPSRGCARICARALKRRATSRRVDDL